MFKSSKYRGLGEFVLLIVGVFLALTAESWLSDRADDQLAESYVSDLRNDLMRDTVVHRMWMDFGEQKITASRALLRQLSDPSAPLSPPETAVALFHAAVPLIVTLGAPTYVDLTGSGNLRLLSPTLRRLIVRYEVMVQSVEDAVESLTRPLSGSGVVPGDMWEGIRHCLQTCGQPEYTASHAQLLDVADSLWLGLDSAQRRRLMDWTLIPGVERMVERELAEGHRFAARFRALLPPLLETLEAAIPK